jgi:hypothetical protein
MAPVKWSEFDIRIPHDRAAATPFLRSPDDVAALDRVFD